MDLTKRWSISEDFADAVYHSHVLEHIPRNKIPVFISECFRVLKKGGIIRVVVPDLEQIARNYLHFLNEILEHETPELAANYEWTLLELMDQLVRNQPGGEMLKFLDNPDMLNRDFVESRTSELTQVTDAKSRKNSSLVTKIKKWVIMNWRSKLYYARSSLKDLLFHTLPGSKYYKIGRFRLGGEVHQWMYDRYSLSRLLADCGFKDIRQTSAFESRISDWETYALDFSGDSIYKPDSLFMEAEK